MVDEAADDRVRLQARRWQRVVEDLGRGRLLHQQLAAPAGPLAADLPLHEELRRHDVQPLADVLAHAHHRLAALGRRAVRVLGLDALVHARQVCRQCLALGLAAGCLSGARRLGRRLRACSAASWASRLAWSAAQVSSNIARCSAFMRFGLGAELPGLEPRQLERDALDLGVAPLDGLRLRVDPLVSARRCVCSARRCGPAFASASAASSSGAQGLEVLGFDRMHIEHAAIVQTPASSRHRVFFQLHSNQPFQPHLTFA